MAISLSDQASGRTVRLRAWRESDAPLVLRAFRVPDLAEQSSLPVVTPQDALGWIASWDGAGHAFAVTVGDDGPVVGNVALTGSPGLEGAWVSYWVLPEVRRLGIAAAATDRLARWAFERLGIHRLRLAHRTDNPASCRVAAKAGFRPEGVERRDGYDVEFHARHG
ncbi:Acetyltransferase (GNAT) family protein [Nonomuraea coxensis DSM 45129]|uniref:Acetyltransferase (GNAT) family protein n=1 Tax=Nonomuraea coxensis DSM 45129 TaxID=1122611 RepID=A0ABX8TRI2_9ACTN|nr:GNAT family N-acetyltransferase [Nonomuraea coxensis]QYC38092.1 Acetyltransferase (GNAT) family protein [Nonomuraea coxensis DSM 45129]